MRLRDLVPEDSEKEAYQEGETEYSQAESFHWGVGRAKNDRRARKWAEAAASLGSHPAQAWCLQEGRRHPCTASASERDRHVVVFRSS